MNVVKLPKLHCKRCGHKWIPRKEGEEPRVCPKCKSPYWNKERGKGRGANNEKAI